MRRVGIPHFRAERRTFAVPSTVVSIELTGLLKTNFTPTADARWMGLLIPVFALGPTWLAAQVMLTVWELQGFDEGAMAKKKAEFYRRARTGAFPIGVTACLAVALMAILFIL